MANENTMGFTKTDIEEERFWQSYARFYHHLEKSKPYQDLVGTIKKLVSPKENEYWLDIGTGSGAIIDILLEKSSNRIGKILAIDSDDTMLKHAIKRKTEKIEFRNINIINSFPFETEVFDGAVANLVLSYIYRFENKTGKDALRFLLKEIYRSLKNNGVLVWSTPIKDVNFFKVFLASWKNVLDPRHLEHLFYGPAILNYALKIQKKGKVEFYNFLTEPELERIHREAGFKNIEFKRSFAGQALIIKAEKNI